MMEALTKLVISTYKHLYQDEKYNLEVIKDNERIIKFKNQTIQLDNFVATRYRLTALLRKSVTYRYHLKEHIV
jgi:hypothetical protein